MVSWFRRGKVAFYRKVQIPHHQSKPPIRGYVTKVGILGVPKEFPEDLKKKSSRKMGAEPSNIDTFTGSSLFQIARMKEDNGTPPQTRGKESQGQTYGWNGSPLLTVILVFLGPRGSTYHGRVSSLFNL